MIAIWRYRTLGRKYTTLAAVRMSAVVPPEIVERTWQRLGALPPKDMLKLQRQSGRLQPELVGFVIGYTSELSPDAVGLALYVMVVVLEMFRVTPRCDLRKVREETILRLWPESQALIQASLDSDGDPLEALLAASTEPTVFEYVFDAFTDTEQEDPVSLSAVELETLLAILRTFIEALHEASSRASR
jgi:hypothetical protein